MSDESSNRNQLSLATLGCLSLMIVPFVISAGTVIFEYAVVQPAAQSWPRTALELHLLLLIGLVVVATRLTMVWTARYRYVRESFAIIALAGILLLLLIGFMSVVSGMVPWKLAEPLRQWWVGQDVTVPPTAFVEYALLLVVIVMLINFLRARHRGWTGLVSVPQHQREELHEQPSLLAEAFAELSRLVHRAPPFPVYVPPQFEPQPILPEDVVESLAWKDQARELLTLSSASYAFSPDTDWHDAQGCWLGLNIHSDGLVLLYPVQISADLGRVSAVAAYARKVADRRGKELDEIIIAMHEQDDHSQLPPMSIQPRVETEHTLLERIANFADYRNDIRRRVTKETLPESALTLEKVYVPPRVRPPQADDSATDLENYLRSWLAEPSRRHLALLGDYGQGKSTAARMFTYRLLFEQQRLPPRVPLLIELRGRNLRNQEPDEILGQWAGRYGMNGLALLRLHEAGRLLLIFEGFDEMAQLADYETRRSYFKALWAFSAYPQAKILITGRPNLFKNPQEMESALGLRDPFPGEAYCEPLHLLPFNVEQMREALRSQTSAVRDQICALAARNPQFYDIVARPALLHVVSVLWDKERLAEHIAELTSAHVMGLFVRNSYTRQVSKERLPFQFSSLNSAERAYFMSGIATYMGASELSNIGGVQLDEQIDQLLEVIPDELSQEVTAIGSQPDAPLRKRLEDPASHAFDPKKMAQLHTDVRASGLLVVDPSAPGAFRFGHKSFMEYLFAEVVAERIQQPKARSARAILNAVDVTIIDILAQPVATIFLAELLSGADQEPATTSAAAALDSAAARDVRRARRLLDAILDIRGPLGSLRRLAVFLTVFVASIDIYRLIRLGRPSPPSDYWADQIGRSFSSMRPIGFISSLKLFLIVSSLSLDIGLLLFFTRTPLRGGRARLRIWNAVCERWQVSDQAMHTAIGTDHLPWAKHRAFLFFLSWSEQASGIIRRLNALTHPDDVLLQQAKLILRGYASKRIKSDLIQAIERVEGLRQPEASTLESQEQRAPAATLDQQPSPGTSGPDDQP